MQRRRERPATRRARFAAPLLALCAALGFAPAVAQTGFLLDSQNSQSLEHTNNTKVWYAHGQWWAIVQDPSADDWFLYENDGALPGSPGTLGGWTRTSVNVDTRNSTLIDLWYNSTGDIVHLLRMHDSGGTYNEYTWDGMLGHYVKDTILGDISIPGARAGASAGIALDSTGQAFVAYNTDGTINVEYSLDATRSLWSTVEIATGVPTWNLSRPALMPFVDSVDGGQMGLLYFSATDTLTFRVHDDDDGDIVTDWPAETVDTATSADDHTCLRSNSVTGDLYAVVRTNMGDVDFYRRPDGGSWSSATTLASGGLIATRPQIAVEEDNNHVYVFWTNWPEGKIVYRRSPANAIDFGVEIEALGHPGVTELDNVQLPKSGVTCATGLMAIAHSVTHTWYDRLEVRWYRDTDGDGYGDSDDSVVACSPPAGFVMHSGDCNLADPNIHPFATEICDGVDNDCDEEIDNTGTPYYRDADADGFGNPNNSVLACSQPPGYILDSTDCNDANTTINPGAAEVCGDGEDNDCDLSIDEEDATGHLTWYPDTDGDNYGVPGGELVQCGQPTGFAPVSTDCDDTLPQVNPGAVEIADGLDNDCDMIVDNLPRPVGYILDSEDGQSFEHTNNTKLWYAHDRWWAIAQDTSSDDWFLYENDGPVPAAQGTQGGWTKTAINIDGRNSTLIDTWHNVAEDVVHVLRMHDSGGTYNEYTWDGGSGGWVKDAVLGDVLIPGARAGSAANIAVDSTGQAFIAYDFAGVVILEFSTTPQRDTWSSITLRSSGPLESFNRTSLIPFNDSIDGPHMAILYFNKDNVLKSRLHDDDDGDVKANWISRNLDTTSAADDHVCIRSNSRTGDLFAVVRTSPGAVEYYYRPDRGGWSGPTTLVAGPVVATRPQIAVDEDANAVYVFWTDLVEDRIVYRRADAGSTVFDPPVVALAYAGLDSFNDVQVPKSGLTAESGLMVLADAEDATWYTPLPIGLRIEFSDATLVEWQGGAGFDAWNLYRGDLATLRTSGTYTQLPGSNALAQRYCGLTSPAVADADPLVAGEVAFYLVTGVFDSVEQGLGKDGNGVQRPHDNPCP